MSLRPLTKELIDHYLSIGAWQDLPLYRHIDANVERTPDKLAVADQHERLSFAELHDRSNRLANGLLALGMEEGDPVAIQASNSTLLSVMHLACDRANLMYVPLSSAWRRTEMRHLLNLSRAKVVLLPEAEKDFDFVDTVQAMRGELEHLRTVVGEGNADLSFGDLLASDSGTVSRRTDPNLPLFVMVTSGTTELPRMSAWTDNNLWFFMAQYRDAVQMEAGDRVVGLAPANTGATGYVFPVLAPMLAGASSVLLEHWEAEAGLDLLEREDATGATAIPTQIIKMLQVDGVEKRSFPNLRYFTNAGAAMPADQARELERVFHCSVQAVYGATDGGVPVMNRIVQPSEKRYVTVGKVLPHSEVRLLDENLSDVPSGERGEIAWRGPTKSFGYLNEPERSEATWWEDGWYRSGDLGQFDADGFLSVVGRAKDLIIRGGQNISPLEIEEAIARHPAVSEVAVVGYPDQVYGERVCACVTLRPGHSLTFDGLIEHLTSMQMAKFKLPERLELFEDLPRSAGAKLNKVEIRKEVATRLT
jgi:non-ribosomal peptide synthetase component E (peptide arylation enzyme)